MRAPPVETRFDLSAVQEPAARPPSIAIIETISHLRGTDPEDLDLVLYESIDPDALDMLFVEDAEHDIEVHLSIEEFEVTVESSGTITVERNAF